MAGPGWIPILLGSPGVGAVSPTPALSELSEGSTCRPSRRWHPAAPRCRPVPPRLGITDRRSRRAPPSRWWHPRRSGRWGRARRAGRSPPVADLHAALDHRPVADGYRVAEDGEGVDPRSLADVDAVAKSRAQRRLTTKSPTTRSSPARTRRWRTTCSPTTASSPIDYSPSIDVPAPITGLAPKRAMG